MSSSLAKIYAIILFDKKTLLE